MTTIQIGHPEIPVSFPCYVSFPPVEDEVQCEITFPRGAMGNIDAPTAIARCYKSEHHMTRSLRQFFLKYKDAFFDMEKPQRSLTIERNADSSIRTRITFSSFSNHADRHNFSGIIVPALFEANYFVEKDDPENNAVEVVENYHLEQINEQETQKKILEGILSRLQKNLVTNSLHRYHFCVNARLRHIEKAFDVYEGTFQPFTEDAEIYRKILNVFRVAKKFLRKLAKEISSIQPIAAFFLFTLKTNIEKTLGIRTKILENYLISIGLEKNFISREAKFDKKLLLEQMKQFRAQMQKESEIPFTGQSLKALIRCFDKKIASLTADPNEWVEKQHYVCFFIVQWLFNQWLPFQSSSSSSPSLPQASSSSSNSSGTPPAVASSSNRNDLSIGPKDSSVPTPLQHVDPLNNVNVSTSTASSSSKMELVDDQKEPDPVPPLIGETGPFSPGFFARGFGQMFPGEDLDLTDEKDEKTN